MSEDISDPREAPFTLHRKVDLVDKIGLDAPDVDEQVLRLLLDAIVALKRTAKTQLAALHPMKQSALDGELKAIF